MILKIVEIVDFSAVNAHLKLIKVADEGQGL